ncbi:MAG: hypothetical protein KME56_19485 [Candidatus Thiodiazotropha sp. (ex Ctena orbiculata)]|nr:hypothetical protein [Candidatus Thiodiazotropha taylori]MBT2998797.1 hypothetical protein [Candidatus Thiodiazotropha taylori]MBT3002327.1 hypothetical protein [Candidatus Thiodiazotropha taylori]MBT3028755.1 hypothetical protein [Candidatus Thiodiazotropha taylori]MBT3036862.1 hypothetical protein [Candidatus Thiodiazotropha taylori]
MEPEEFVTEVLSSMGFGIEPIETGEDKTPDFLVRGDDSLYLIEVKTKNSDPAILEEREKVLKKGEVFQEDTPVARRNRISGVISSAVKQLNSYDSVEHNFKLVFLLANGHHPDVQMSVFESCLYGVKDAVDFVGEGGVLPAYFADNSDFYNLQESLDGAIVSTERLAKFCLNPHSPRYEELRNSELRRAFKKGVCDPIQQEEAGIAFVVDGDVNRRDENEVLEYLK